MENLATSSKPYVHSAERQSTGIHEVKSSASHSSSSSTWNSSCCEKTMGLSDGDDCDDLTWSPGSEPRQRRSIEQRSPMRTLSPENGLYMRKTPPMSISSTEIKGGNANGHCLRGRRQAGPHRHGGANRNEEESNKEESFRSNEAVGNHGFSANLASGNGTSPWHAKEAGAPHPLPDHVQEQERILPVLTHRDSLTEIQPNVQVLPLASCSLMTASNSEFQPEAGEDAPVEETDIYPPPLLQLQFRQFPQLPNDLSEGGDDRTLDPHFKPESDLYQPINRAEDAHWHGMEIPDSSKHAGLSMIDHNRAYLPEKLASAGSFDQLPLWNITHHCKDFDEEKRYARMSQLVSKCDTGSDIDAVHGGIHDAHELSRPRLSGLSPSPAYSGFRDPRIIAPTVAFTPPERISSAQYGPHPLCSFCPQHLNLQNHQLVHLTPLQQHWASFCRAQPVCAVGNSPHQHHRVPCHHAQLSQHFPAQVIGRHVGKEQEQLCDAHVTLQRTKIRIPKRRPPFPSQGAAPYVLCQHCARLLQAPACSPPTHATTLKLRCGSCWRVSKFGVQHPRKPQMSTRSFTDGSACSSEASFHFSAAEHVSTVRSGLGEESNSPVNEVSNIWPRYCAGNSSPMSGRHFGNVRPFGENAGALSTTLTGDSVFPRDDNAEFPGRESTSSSAILAGSDTLNISELTLWDSPDGEEAGVIGSSLLKTGTDSNGEWGNGNCVSPRNDFHRQDAPVPSSSTNDPQRNQSEKEDCSLSCSETVLANSERPGSPLYKLLGYNSPADLRQNSPTNGTCSDAYCSARVSDAGNGNIEKLTFPPSTHREEKLSCNHQRTSDASEACAECPEVKREWCGDSAHNDDNLYSVSFVATKTLVEPEQAAAKLPTGFFKRSLKGLAEKGAHFSGSSRQRVIVNGVVLSGAAIKKAEDRAGKLRPGCYWYDRKAGFWGVTGGPCVGILPAFIEEFNSSLARDCSNGTTEVVVNGRELLQEDLDKLVRRGLSREARKIYMILHDGTVIDETTGEKLRSLGMLAPTVERRGKGFGMFTAPSGTN